MTEQYQGYRCITNGQILVYENGEHVWQDISTISDYDGTLKKLLQIRDALNSRMHKMENLGVGIKKDVPLNFGEKVKDAEIGLTKLGDKFSLKSSDPIYLPKDGNDDGDDFRIQAVNDEIEDPSVFQNASQTSRIGRKLLQKNVQNTLKMEKTSQEDQKQSLNINNDDSDANKSKSSANSSAKTIVKPYETPLLNIQEIEKKLFKKSKTVKSDSPDDSCDSDSTSDHFDLKSFIAKVQAKEKGELNLSTDDIRQQKLRDYMASLNPEKQNKGSDTTTKESMTNSALSPKIPADYGNLLRNIVDNHKQNEEIPPISGLSHQEIPQDAIDSFSKHKNNSYSDLKNSKDSPAKYEGSYQSSISWNKLHETDVLEESDDLVTPKRRSKPRKKREYIEPPKESSLYQPTYTSFIDPENSVLRDYALQPLFFSRCRPRSYEKFYTDLKRSKSLLSSPISTGNSPIKQIPLRTKSPQDHHEILKDTIYQNLQVKSSVLNHFLLHSSLESNKSSEKIQIGDDANTIQCKTFENLTLDVQDSGFSNVSYSDTNSKHNGIFRYTSDHNASTYKDNSKTSNSSKANKEHVNRDIDNLYATKKRKKEKCSHKSKEKAEIDIDLDLSDDMLQDLYMSKEEIEKFEDLFKD